MVLLLQRALELLGPEQAEQMALEVGETYGRALAETMGAEQGQRSVRAAMESVASAMTAHGFAARAEGDADAAAVVASQCPFGDAAQHQPVLCAAERGMVTGLLGGLCGDELSQKVAFSSRARGDASCRSSL